MKTFGNSRRSATSIQKVWTIQHMKTTKETKMLLETTFCIVQLYEYLAFAHTLNTNPDYLGLEPKPDDPEVSSGSRDRSES